MQCRGQGSGPPCCTWSRQRLFGQYLSYSLRGPRGRMSWTPLRPRSTGDAKKGTSVTCTGQQRSAAWQGNWRLQPGAQSGGPISPSAAAHRSSCTSQVAKHTLSPSLFLSHYLSLSLVMAEPPSEVHGITFFPPWNEPVRGRITVTDSLCGQCPREAESTHRGLDVCALHNPAFTTQRSETALGELGRSKSLQ